ALRERHDHAACLLAELRRVIADVAEALYHDALAREAGRQTERFHVLGLRARFPEPVEDAASCRLDATPDPALRHWLAGDTGERVDLSRIEGRVRVRDPRHLARAGPVVRGEDVDAGADEVLLDELRRVAAGDLLDLVGRVLLGVDADTTLRAAERHVDDR